MNDAIELINMVPRNGFCEMRGGYAEHSLIEPNTGIQGDGTNYLDGGDAAVLDFNATADLSVELWFQLTGSESETKVLLAKTEGSTGYEVVWDNSDGTVYLFVGDGTNFVLAASTSTINDVLPHHLAFTVDRTADEVDIYIDGAPDSASPVDISTVTGSLENAFAFRLFTFEGVTSIFSGWLDDVRVWSDVRTADEIRDNYQSELTGSETGLVGYWKMNGLVGGSVTTVADDSPSANTLTDTGGGDLTYADASSSFERELDIDLCTEFYDGINRQLISASPTNIYNSTAVGAATSLGSGFTSGRWDTATMNGIMGFVNGADA
jgi:hypothetical protein